MRVASHSTRRWISSSTARSTSGDRGTVTSCLGRLGADDGLEGVGQGGGRVVDRTGAREGGGVVGADQNGAVVADLAQRLPGAGGVAVVAAVAGAGGED